MRVILGSIVLAFLLGHDVCAQQTSGQDLREAHVIREIVNRWDKANRVHDTDELERLYAFEVSFYTKTMSREAVIIEKKKFFQRFPEFKQTIKQPIIVTKRDNVQGYLARFTKEVMVGGRTTLYPSYLVIDSVEDQFGGKPDAWRIVIESDKKTDTNVLRRLLTVNPSRFSSCEDVRSGIVRSGTAVKKEMSHLIIFELDNRDTADVYHFHLYYDSPIAEMVMTEDWLSFDARTKKLKDFNGNILNYDRELLPYLKKF